jgi:hypothetical protein
MATLLINILSSFYPIVCLNVCVVYFLWLIFWVPYPVVHNVLHRVHPKRRKSKAKNKGKSVLEWKSTKIIRRAWFFSCLGKQKILYCNRYCIFWNTDKKIKIFNIKFCIYWYPLRIFAHIFLFVSFWHCLQTLKPNTSNESCKGVF